MKPARVLVTGTGGTGVGAGIIQALSGLPAWELVAVCADPFSWGLYQTPHRAVVPWAGDVGYLGAIAGLVEQYGVAAVIPGTEAETAILSRWWGTAVTVI